MGTTGIVMFIVIGGLAGWIAGLITKGSGFGIIFNIIIGIVGAYIGTAIMSALGWISVGTFGYFIASIVGAVILLFILRIIRRLFNMV